MAVIATEACSIDPVSRVYCRWLRLVGIERLFPLAYWARAAFCTMPSAAQLRLPSPAPAPAAPTFSSTTADSDIRSLRTPARPSGLASAMSVFSNDDAESTFSSLLRSVAAKEDDRERLPSSSEDQGGDPLERPDGTIPGRSFILVDDVIRDPQGSTSGDPSGDVAARAQAPSPSIRNQPKPNGDEEARMDSIQAWIAQQQLHLRSDLGALTEEAGSAILASESRKPAVSDTPYGSQQGASHG